MISSVAMHPMKWSGCNPSIDRLAAPHMATFWPKREWMFAKAWLFDRLEGAGTPD